MFLFFFFACVRATVAFDLMNVNMCIFILYLCRACWLLNILSGHVKCERKTEHRMCSSGPQRAVRAHSLTHSLSHSFSYSLTHFCFHPPSLPPALSSPLPAPLHCYTWHNGPIIVPFCLSVTSAHSALIQIVFVLGHHVKIASIHTCMSKTVCWQRGYFLL